MLSAIKRNCLTGTRCKKKTQKKQWIVDETTSMSDVAVTASMSKTINRWLFAVLPAPNA